MRRFAPLLELDADLGEAVPPEELADARRLATVPLVEVQAGPCDISVLDPGDGAADEPFAALVVSGLLVQNVELSGRLAAQLIGPGDVVFPWDETAEPPASGLALTSSERSRLAILDRRFLLITRRWPQIGAAVLMRSHHQIQRAAVQHAISQLSRVEDRVLATLWHLAQRWGTVTPRGTVVTLALTHETIGRLVGARRPTVTLALTTLASSELVVRRPDGSWLLLGPPPDGEVEPSLIADVVRRVPPHGDAEAAPEPPAVDREALLARIVTLREVQTRMTERVTQSLRAAAAARDEAADLRARVHTRDRVD